jgi:hypothetical protein
VLLRAIFIGFAFFGLAYWALLPQSGIARQVFHRWAIRLALVGVILLLLRLGLPWLAMAGTALVALVRYLLPIAARLFPVWFVARTVSRARAGGNQPQTAHPSASADMTRSRALEVLNLPDTASREDVLLAHRELIKRVHPDRGGSSYLAAEVNRARDVLLSGSTRST